MNESVWEKGKENLIENAKSRNTKTAEKIIFIVIPGLHAWQISALWIWPWVIHVPSVPSFSLTFSPYNQRERPLSRCWCHWWGTGQDESIWRKERGGSCINQTMRTYISFKTKTLKLMKTYRLIKDKIIIAYGADQNPYRKYHMPNCHMYIKFLVHPCSAFWTSKTVSNMSPNWKNNHLLGTQSHGVQASVAPMEVKIFNVKVIGTLLR